MVGHINGGTTSMSEREIDSLVATHMALEIVHCGNGKTALHTLAKAADARALHRIIIGNDAPSGTGVVPLGILRVLAHLVSLGGVPPEEAVCMATGNTARMRALDWSTIPWEASTEAATRSIESQARSRLLTLTFDISQ